MKRAGLIFSLTITGMMVMVCGLAQGSTASPSILQQELVKVRYGYASQMILADAPRVDTAATPAKEAPSGSKYKSPGKAFLMSLIVPGAGQFYYGSKIKAALFLGIEAATIGLSVKYHSDGNRLTNDFQQFNLTHWSRSDYTYYLQQAYGVSTDDSVDAGLHPEVSHHLPATGDGQYYEMSGKYNQFAWGWDDAALPTGQTLHQSNFVPAPITDPATTPLSANRTIYETMRHDANNKFTQSTTMLFGTLLNHVVSAFEAYISVRRHNGGSGSGPTEFSSRIKVDAQLKSVYARRDTPYVKVTYKF